MTDLIAEARQDLRNIIRYLHPGEDKHRARAISSADAVVDRLRDEIDRLRGLSQNNAHSWDALVKERDALRTSLAEMLADLDDPDLIEISAATITRARQALSSGDQT